MYSTITWKSFRIDYIFEILNGKGITTQEISEHQGELAAVQSAESNNGVIGYIDEDYCLEKHYTIVKEPCLTVARTGSAGYVTFQEKGCCVGDSAKILRLKKRNQDNEVFLFLRTILMMNKYRYTFARKVTAENYASEIIELPTDGNEEPDYIFMSNYMKRLKGSITNIPDYFLQEGYEKACWYMDNIDQTAFENKYAGSAIKDKLHLNVEKWREFHLYDLFKIEAGNKFDKSKMTMGAPSVNFVGRSSEKNGVTAYVDEIEGIKPYKAGYLTVALGGEYIGSCFVQDYPFYTSKNVNVLIPLVAMDIYAKLFIAHLIRFESASNYKAFARELNAHIKTDFVIKIPVNENNLPDFNFMSSYIKSLSFSRNLL